jgi:hypothetical protein
MHLRCIRIRLVPLLLTAGCCALTECDCIAPSVTMTESAAA